MMPSTRKTFFPVPAEFPEIEVVASKWRVPERCMYTAPPCCSTGEGSIVMVYRAQNGVAHEIGSSQVASQHINTNTRNQSSQIASNSKTHTQQAGSAPHTSSSLSNHNTERHTPPRASHNTHMLTPPTETHQTQQIPVPHQSDTQHRPQALREMETDTDTNHPETQATPRCNHKTDRVSLSTSSSLSNHNPQKHTSKSKTQHSQPDTTHGNTPETADSSNAPGRHTTPRTSTTRDGNRHGNKPGRTTSNNKVQT